MKIKEALLVFMLLIMSTPVSASTIQGFSFTDIKGTTRSWADMKGSPVVVNIGSHW